LGALVCDRAVAARPARNSSFAAVFRFNRATSGEATRGHRSPCYGTVRGLPAGASGFTTVELKSNLIGTAREGIVVLG
jgi:hypothetical protein